MWENLSIHWLRLSGHVVLATWSFCDDFLGVPWGRLLDRNFMQWWLPGCDLPTARAIYSIDLWATGHRLLCRDLLVAIGFGNLVATSWLWQTALTSSMFDNE